jgi:cytochrome c peroxidase
MTSRLFAAALLTVLPAGAAPLDEPIKPVPLSLHQDPARAALGRQLFHDARLSANNRVSCASCHDLARGGADRRQRSQGFGGGLTAVNTPTVLNAALNFRQFWDGRAATLEEQIDKVVENPVEMGSSWPEVLRKVGQDAGYRRSFAALYAGGVTKANIQNAIASYERTLITPNARFDRYLRGESDAITQAEKIGYAKFKQFGCVACHQGVNVGGNMFQKFGVMGDYLGQRGATVADQGRYQATRDPADLHVFKVPSLRNVSETGPYFHDASAATLEQAIDVMFQFQLGRAGSKQDRADIIAFLKTLNATPEGQP